jgi:hypothetical protein
MSKVKKLSELNINEAVHPDLKSIDNFILELESY